MDGSGDVASETEDRTFRLNKEACDISEYLLFIYVTCDKLLFGSKTHQKLLFNL